MYYLYAVLSFAEVGVLFASASSLFVFLLKEIIKAIDRLLETVLDGEWFGLQSGAGRFDSLRATGKNPRLYKIVGGHNERF